MLFLRLHLGTGRPKCSSVDEKKKKSYKICFLWSPDPKNRPNPQH